MASISGHPKSITERSDARRASTEDPVLLLVFCGAGLLIDVVALLMQGAAHMGPLRFALIAGAAPIAALITLGLAGRGGA